MNKPVTILVAATCVFFTMAVFVRCATAKPLQIGGSVRSLNIYGEAAPAELFPDYYFSSNRVRLDAAWQPDQNLKIETALDYQHLWSDPTESFKLTGRNYNRQLEMEETFDHGDAGSSHLQLDRFNLHWRQGQFDTTIGRQAIGFGRILINSPLDIIAPFAPDAIDTEIRNGVDALRAHYSYGLDGQIGAIAIWGTEQRYNSYLGTWTDNLNNLDFLFIGGKLRGRNVVGAGLAGSLGSLGLKGEVSLHEGRELGEQGGDLYSSYTLGAIEGWYRFDNGISLVIEYLYNGAGTNRPDEYPQVLISGPVQEGLSHLLGRQYLLAAPSYELHPLVTAQGLIIYNLSDDSALIRPTLDISLSDNLSLQLFWAWALGDQPNDAAPSLSSIPRSEFGMRGDSGGLFCQWYF